MTCSFSFKHIIVASWFLLPVIIVHGLVFRFDTNYLNWHNYTDEREDKETDLCMQIKDNAKECIVSSVELSNMQEDPVTRMGSDAEIELVGATLQLRGLSLVIQPLEDISRNLLVYNGTSFYLMC